MNINKRGMFEHALEGHSSIRSHPYGIFCEVRSALDGKGQPGRRDESSHPTALPYLAKQKIPLISGISLSWRKYRKWQLKLISRHSRVIGCDTMELRYDEAEIFWEFFTKV